MIHGRAVGPPAGWQRAEASAIVGACVDSSPCWPCSASTSPPAVQEGAERGRVLHPGVGGFPARGLQQVGGELSQPARRASLPRIQRGSRAEDRRRPVQGSGVPGGDRVVHRVSSAAVHQRPPGAGRLPAGRSPNNRCRPRIATRPRRTRMRTTRRVPDQPVRRDRPRAAAQHARDPGRTSCASRSTTPATTTGRPPRSG